MRKLGYSALLKRIQEQLVELRKMDEKEDPKKLRLKIEKARAIGYLVSVASQVLEKHELSKRLDELERRIEEFEKATQFGKAD